MGFLSTPAAFGRVESWRMPPEAGSLGIPAVEPCPGHIRLAISAAGTPRLAWKGRERPPPRSRCQGHLGLEDLSLSVPTLAQNSYSEKSFWEGEKQGLGCRDTSASIWVSPLVCTRGPLTLSVWGFSVWEIPFVRHPLD